MSIQLINENSKTIKVKIPLTTTTGKIRIKQRDNIYGYGQPFPSRSKNFNQKNYVEWQISYDIEENNDKIYLSALKQYKFIAHNGKNKLLFELSEYLYHLINFDLVSLIQLKKLKNFIDNLTENELLSNHPHCEIKRTHPKIQKINDLNFEILKVEYPQLIYRFKNYEVIAEIIIREKQKAVGVQPLLFFCFPITELIADEPLLGRTAKTNEYAYFEINNNNSFVFFEITKIFGMLSPNHRFDILEILNLLLQIFDNKT